eukprot:tig00000042_g15508.t1
MSEAANTWGLWQKLNMFCAGRSCSKSAFEGYIPMIPDTPSLPFGQSIDDLPTCPPCLIYESYYTKERALGYCKSCGGDVRDQSCTYCASCARSLRVCYFCGLSAFQSAEEWMQTIEEVAAKEIARLSTGPFAPSSPRKQGPDGEGGADGQAPADAPAQSPEEAAAAAAAAAMAAVQAAASGAPPPPASASMVDVDLVDETEANFAAMLRDEWLIFVRVWRLLLNRTPTPVATRIFYMRAEYVALAEEMRIQMSAGVRGKLV